jgi:hypothetical protein
LPDEDEKPLIALVEKYGMSRVLGVLARLQREGDRLAGFGKKAVQEALDTL